MAAAPQAVSAPQPAAPPGPSKRKRPSKGKGSKSNKKKKLARSDQDDPARRRRNKPSAKFLKLLRKRARDYNSDDDDEEEEEGDGLRQERPPSSRRRRDGDGDDYALSLSEQEDEDNEEEGVSGSGVTRFEQGCRAFRVAFLKIMAKKLPDDPLGPILSAHKKLVAAKLAEEEGDYKPKGETRKDKRVAAEKGHVIPKGLLDTKEKQLIKVATQGVVRLFNAVNKAQKTRKDLNPSRSKDAKILAKERRNTFLAELEIKSEQNEKSQSSVNISKHGGKDEDEPVWAPLRDTFMLGSKLKDWDKMQDSAPTSEQTKAPLGDSSDEE